MFRLLVMYFVIFLSIRTLLFFLSLFFFFNDTATTEIYTLSLHDALPISGVLPDHGWHAPWSRAVDDLDRKSTRLNSSHANISYAVFCLKKKKHKRKTSPSMNLTTSSAIASRNTRPR